MSEPLPLVFDLGGVLIDWDPRRIYVPALGEAAAAFLLERVCTHTWNLAMDAGRPFDEAIAEKQREWPEHAEAIGWWKTRWTGMLGGPLDGTVALLGRLQAAGHPTYALSNWSAETFPEALARYPFLRTFRDIAISGEAGLVKPDPAFFRLAADRWGIPLAGTVFIDDAPRNVAAAAALGMDALLFTDPGRLQADLARRGFPA
ncbi:HAD family hydrolase [Mesoterricola sediminis]|uniref:Hydrolase n=1 Tax=Mesoterricola sediminis TaxID=2927980 RepID=A0AA48KC54_9BACT|nr:HAD family phosphatase [Mesoterricola sediminis]BDU76656.1 hydrolase [Mesoterricola sediminis]